MGSIINFPTANAQVCRCGRSWLHFILPVCTTGSLWMYYLSPGVQEVCSSGFLENHNQRMSQANPREPVSRNAQRQPRWTAIHGTMSGVTMAPTLVPALKTPVASARSFFGNHSATHLRLAGNTPASPKPRADRATTKLVSECAIACPIDAKLQKIMAAA